jgi:hypothetical protein
MKEEDLLSNSHIKKFKTGELNFNFEKFEIEIFYLEKNRIN